MIIKMTVHDNDFTEKIENFCKNLLADILYGEDENYDKMTIEEKFNWWQQRTMIQTLMNPNNDDSLTHSQRFIICEEVKKLWHKYVDNHRMSCNSHDEYRVKQYLKKAFRVQINYQMNDRWENGETVYYFTTNQKFITQ